MRKLIPAFLFALLLTITGSSLFAQSYNQLLKIEQGAEKASLVVGSKYNYVTVVLYTLASTDSVKFYSIDEQSDTVALNVKNLATNTAVASNLVTGLTGKYEFLVGNGNLYKIMFKHGGALALAKDIYGYVRRRNVPSPY